MYSIFDRWEEATESALRIYDPFAYRPALYERIVPVCLSESLRLAERWPVLWRRDDHGDPELVVLRGLVPRAELPGARTQSRTSLPLLLQAFPFRYHDTARGDEIGLDRASPMHERDAGSYILDERGNLSPGAELKIRALEAWGAEIETRALLTNTVFRHGLVEPVLLPDGMNEKFALPDLFAVLPAPDDTLIFGALPREQWLLVARFLAAQRLSLYTMARLIAQVGEVA
ncbi:SapC family protein [Paracoccus ravus]|uniref:SapC family protein n=1 Tax=Paracoccus ravus TaxID=2447760 RepID=UPI00106EDD52|nr:SapC family protein [Paracoccus ravus]